MPSLTGQERDLKCCHHQTINGTCSLHGTVTVKKNLRMGASPPKFRVYGCTGRLFRADRVKTKLYWTKRKFTGLETHILNAPKDFLELCFEQGIQVLKTLLKGKATGSEQKERTTLHHEPESAFLGLAVHVWCGICRTSWVCGVSFKNPHLANVNHKIEKKNSVLRVFFWGGGLLFVCLCFCFEAASSVDQAGF